MQPRAAVLALSMVLGPACAIEGPADDERFGPQPWGEEQLPETRETALAEQNFNRHDVLDTASMEDHTAMTLAQVQDFLDHNPYGWRSVLADHVSNGRTAAQAFIDAAQTHRVNPLVLLTRVQMEQSLIGRTSVSSSVLDKAMGCGCPDNQPCQSKYKGFDKQIDCAAEKFRSYLDDMDQTGKTIAGWGVGVTKITLDGQSVTPVNQATAALYTYTPWVSAARSHAKIWALYTAHVGYTGPSSPPPVEDPPMAPPNGPIDVVIDDDPNQNPVNAAFDAGPSWVTSNATSGYQGSGYTYRTTGASSDLANFRVMLTHPALVVVEAWWTAGSNRASSAPFLIYDGDGNHLGTVHVDQTSQGQRWVTLGTFNFSAGWNTVALSRWTSSGDVVIADAIRIHAPN